MELTNKQWTLVHQVLTRMQAAGTKGIDVDKLRAITEAILWTHRTGAAWRDLPERFPPFQTVHRLYLAWNNDGVWQAVVHALSDDLEQRGGLELSALLGSDCSVITEPKTADLEQWELNTARLLLSPVGRVFLAAATDKTLTGDSDEQLVA